MSYNKFAGTCDAMSNYSLQYNEVPTGQTPTQLIFKVNRLSGNLPISFHPASIINILDGNYFQCRDTTTELPINDPQFQYYSCGSSVLQFSLSIFTSILLSAIVIPTCYWVFIFYKRSAIPNVRSVIHDIYDYYYRGYYYLLSLSSGLQYVTSQTVEIYSMLHLFHYMREFVVKITFCILFVFMTTYLILNIPYATTQYQYGWVVSGGFITGIVPAIVLFVLWSLFLWYVYQVIYVMHHNLQEYMDAAINQEETSSSNPMERPTVDINKSFAPSNYLRSTVANLQSTIEQTKLFMKSALTAVTTDRHVEPKYIRPKKLWKEVLYLYVAVPVINGVIVLAINGVYVYIIITKSTAVILLAQIAFVISKTYWNSRIVPELVKAVKHFQVDVYKRSESTGLNQEGGETSDGVVIKRSERHYQVHVLLLVFNNVCEWII